MVPRTRQASPRRTLRDGGRSGRLAADAQLAVRVRTMPFDGPWVNSSAAMAPLPMPRAASRRTSSCAGEGFDGFEAMPVVGPPIGFEEVADLSHERRPCRLVGEQDGSRCRARQAGRLGCVRRPRRRRTSSMIADRRMSVGALMPAARRRYRPPAARAYGGSAMWSSVAGRRTSASALASGMKIRVKTRRRVDPPSPSRPGSCSGRSPPRPAHHRRTRQAGHRRCCTGSAASPARMASGVRHGDHEPPDIPSSAKR